MIYCVGLTGNIASGKTSAAEIFARLGVDVINSDSVSRELTAHHQSSYKKIVTHFGSGVLLKDGQLNRKRLREIIFSNAEERKWLEDLLHPLIRERIIEEINLSTKPYCIIEIPLIIDKKFYPYLNKILLMSAPKEVQIARVITRDHCSRKQALAVLSAQSKIGTRIENADDILTNDSGFTQLQHAVEHLHHQYLQEAQRKN